ncbi:MAG: GH3 auxin-responsive promoter family protein [Bacteroidales bacterium]|nr:GH3 auxin-responsive promoter family protein [Bacteroidales bacterium]MDD4602271.1 GH3 auxin-responsive promoter family protein [Bacteroidales bacterium]
MALLNSVVSWVMKKRIHQIELFMKYPHEVQSEWLRKLLNVARNTEWGKKYGFKSLTTPEQFQQRVPINDYETIKSEINRLRKGEQNILWPSEIKWFAKSSGTTDDKSKFIPVSQEALEECHFKGGKDLLSIYCNNQPETKLFDGKAIAMGGSHQIMEVNNELYYQGDLSAILIQNLPGWVEFLRTPNLSIALMDEWESKIEMMAQATIQHDVTNISGVPSWTLLLFKRILEMTSKKNLLEVWPNFELFIHGGVNFSPYQEQFYQLLPSSKINYLETYNASEGFFGIQDRRKADDMLLMLDYGIYYEFIPVDKLSSDNPQCLSLWDVDLQTNYAIVITTNAGLWRYLIGDTIQFTSLSPYRIKITGRTKNFINAFGEELIVDNAEKAIAIACARCNATITEFTAAPVYLEGSKKGAHEWFIEFATPPSDLSFFSSILDTALKSLNSDYESKRYHGMLLEEPRIRLLPPGTFYRWLKSKNKLGGQHKVPRLSNDRKYVEEILELLVQN